MKDERGFALLAVMLVLTLLSVVVMELAVSMRLEASMGRSFKEGLLAYHLAEAAVQQALREILSQAPIQAVDETGQLVFYRAVPGSPLPTKLPALPRERVAFGPGEFSYRLTDEESRLNLNTASSDRLDRLVGSLGLDKQARDIIGDSLQDWKDSDELHRVNGAESEDHYRKLPVPYRARNGLLQDPAELMQIRGVTRRLYQGQEDKPGLGDLVTVHSRGAVNLNTASAAVLTALGLSEAEVADVLQTRIRAPYTAVPGRFAGRGLEVGGATFRIEAEGWVGGVRRARIFAIVQRWADQPASPSSPSHSVAPLGIVTLLWRPGADR